MRNESVTDKDRSRFDAILESLIPTLPARVRQVMEEIPIVVEDFPDAKTMRQMRIKHPANLLGLYHGVSIDRRSLEDAPRPGDMIYLYRLGLMAASSHSCGAVDDAALREEIRKTLLHEIGHYHGMDEEELEDLGY